MTAFYQPWADVRDDHFDGFIVTGAPVEHLAFEDVRYWRELSPVFNWTQTHVHNCFTICWAAQAAVYHFHGVPKRLLPRKAFGVFRHRNRVPSSPYLRGFSDDFSIPVSRWTEVRREDIPDDSGMQILADSEQAGLCLLHGVKRRPEPAPMRHKELDAGLNGHPETRCWGGLSR